MPNDTIGEESNKTAIDRGPAERAPDLLRDIKTWSPRTG
jgi:hypothetical protein